MRFLDSVAVSGKDDDWQADRSMKLQMDFFEKNNLKTEPLHFF